MTDLLMIVKRLLTRRARGLLLGLLLLPSLSAAANPAEEGEMAGYLLVPVQRVPETYGGGFSMYVAAWPLLS
ncbi:MAG: hypothetical protein KDM81_17255, partial [Verrucomicrobiae bacterium]|nr:hypothetical protein [Verrucomicrobiae bacterium]